jgi:hypothetical protein
MSTILAAMRPNLPDIGKSSSNPLPIHGLAIAAPAISADVLRKSRLETFLVFAGLILLI